MTRQIWRVCWNKRPTEFELDYTVIYSNNNRYMRISIGLDWWWWPQLRLMIVMGSLLSKKKLWKIEYLEHTWKAEECTCTICILSWHVILGIIVDNRKAESLPNNAPEPAWGRRFSAHLQCLKLLHYLFWFPLHDTPIFKQLRCIYINCALAQTSFHFVLDRKKQDKTRFGPVMFINNLHL